MSEKEFRIKLQNLRYELHRFPELSGNEICTIEKISKFMLPNHPDKMVKFGENGAAFIFKGINKGKTIVIRCDTDALPVEEKNTFKHRSRKKNAAHLCGHDGHMTIVAGLSTLLHENPPKKGNVVLLFQPEEETGQGARKILSDKNFSALKPDYIIGFHNIPGYEKKQIIVSDSVFASASSGMIIRYEGKTSHASEPEKGVSPALAVSDLISALNKASSKKDIQSGTFITIVHSVIGERTFGTSPGEANLMATLRSSSDKDFVKLKKNASLTANKIAKKHNLKCNIEWTEEFAAVENDMELVKIISQCATENKMKITRRNEPFRWSEDFGFYTQKYKGAMFGIGAGKDSAPLHSQNYDFPDKIIPDAIDLLYSVIKKSL